MRGFFKLAFGVSVFSLAALSAPACGGDDDSSGGSGGSGATGGGGTGGTDGGTVTCGTNTCESWKVAGLFKVGACCPTEAPDTCGADVDSTVGGLIDFPAGCYQVKGGGALDCGCPSKFFKSPVDGSDSVFNGCCAPSGECGLWVNLSAEGSHAAEQKGPNLECVPLTKLGQSKVSCTVGSETPPQPEADGGEGDCPNPDAGTGGSGGAAGGGGTAGSSSGGTAGSTADASTD